ncbi:MAG: O-antigen ligase family protein [Salibacteraceae bacterium]|nr:O-antigen ligase family protein [Salibacteraceae bacterium]
MNKPWFNTIEKLLLTVLSSFVLLPNGVSSIALISLLLVSILRRPQSILPKAGEWAHFTLPFLMLVAWTLSGFAKDGGREIQLWLSWIAAFFYFKSSPFKAWFKDSFKWISLIQAALFLGYVAYISPNLASEGYSYFLREAVTKNLHVHPTFLTMAWTWAALLFVIEAFKNRTWIQGLMTIVLFAAAAFAGGKMPLLVAAFVLLIWAWNEIASRGKRIAVLVGILLVLGANLAFNPVITERFEEFKNISLDFEHDNFISSTELRIGVWSCALETAVEHWFSGVGLGHTRAALDGCFKQYNHPVFFDGEYNEHNQFLHVWLAGGIFSILIFLGYWVWLKWELIIAKNWLAYYFLIYFLLNLLTENYLNRQFGMMLGAFMLFGLMEKSVTNSSAETPEQH